MRILREILLLLAIVFAIYVLACVGEEAQSAPLKCVTVQVNEGAPTSGPADFQAILPPGGCVRDVLGWHQVEKTKGVYSLSISSQQYIQDILAADAGMKNLVTLAFGNKLYGGNNQTFPTTPEQIAAFKNYAVWVVTKADIPNLYAVSIWNEMNGSFGGGITKPADREAAYAKLVNVVGPAIRAANPNVKIILGATVGSNIGGWYVHLFRDQAMWGRNDPGVFLDVHPYIGKGMTPQKPVPPQLTAWTNSMTQIRKAGIANALFATEFGDGVAATAEGAVPGLNYLTWTQAFIFARENFAGVAWFTLAPAGKFTSGTLLDQSGAPTRLGTEFQAWQP